MRAACRARTDRGGRNVGVWSPAGTQGHHPWAGEHRDLTGEAKRGAKAETLEDLALGGIRGGEPLAACHHLDAADPAVGRAAAEGDGQRDLVAEVEQARGRLRCGLDRRSAAALDAHGHHGGEYGTLRARTAAL